MDSQPRGNLALPASGLLLLLATAMGLTWLDQPLKSTRPKQPESFTRETFGVEDVRGRLWEDPLALVRRARKLRGETSGSSEKNSDSPEGNSNSHGLFALAEHIQNKTGDQKVVLMPVMVPGSSHSEDAESRRRTRQALVSALAVKGYIPRSGDHIGYVNTWWYPTQGRMVLESGTGDGVPLPIPFEWFERETLRPERSPDSPDQILLLWLDESAFEDLMMVKLNNLLGHLLGDVRRKSTAFRSEPRMPDAVAAPTEQQPASSGTKKSADAAAMGGERNKSPSLDPRFRICLIGPSNSSTLSALLKSDSGLASADASKSQDSAVGHGDEELKQALITFESKITDWEMIEYPLKTILPPLSDDPASRAVEIAERKRQVELDGKKVEEYQIRQRDQSIEITNSLEPVISHLKSFVYARYRESRIGDTGPSSAEKDLEQFSDVIDDPIFWHYTVEAANDRDDGSDAIRVGDPNVPTALIDTNNVLAKWFSNINSELTFALADDIEDRSEFSEDWPGEVMDAWQSTIAGILRSSPRQFVPLSNILPNLEIFSCVATAPEALLLNDRDVAALGADTNSTLDHSLVAADLYRRFKCRYVSTVVQDDELAMALVDELYRRGVDLVDDKQHVALVSEWDSFYGRALPLAMEAVIQFRQGEESARWSRDGTLKLKLSGDVGAPPRVHRFSYMRGIDGSTAGSSPASASSQDGKKDSGKSVWEFDVKQGEQAVGASSLDYIRRVATKLMWLNRDLKTKGERLGAVGVVGSDVYDKLLVLQALRKRFPDVLFFTTDLDARLFDAGQYDWCRNLIVASSYGLQLHPDLQQHIPPFRDSYQTSTFFAGLLALGNVEVRQNAESTEPQSGFMDSFCVQEVAEEEKVVLTSESDLRPYLKPRLYEVSRSGVYDLTPDAFDSKLHPARVDGRPSFRGVLVGVAALVLAVMLLIPMNRWFFRYWVDPTSVPSENREIIRLFAFLSLFLSIGLGVLIYLDGLCGTGEPFELLEGISIWPTEICRLVMILLSGAFIATAISRIRKSDDQLKNDNIRVPGDVWRKRPGFWTIWMELRDRLSRKRDLNENPTGQRILARLMTEICHELKCCWRARLQISINRWRRRIRENSESVDVTPVWRHYEGLGRISCRFWRCTVIAVVYLVFGWTLAEILGEDFVPYRGRISALTDSTLGFLSEFSLVVLTFFIVDASRLCEALVYALAERRTKWPMTPFVTSLTKNRGMKVDDLSEFIDIQVIARRTEVVGRLITYPFIVLFVGLISLNAYFDHWQVSLQAVLFFGIILGYALISALLLRRAAENARGKAINNLNARISQLRTSSAKASQWRIEQLKTLRGEIESIVRGAFSPLSSHPVVRAVLIPFGGLGTMAVLDFLSAFGG